MNPLPSCKKGAPARNSKPLVSSVTQTLADEERRKSGKNVKIPALSSLVSSLISQSFNKKKKKNTPEKKTTNSAVEDVDDCLMPDNGPANCKGYSHPNPF